MTGTVRLTLEPLGHSLSVPHGASLDAVLFEQGVEFPCGSRGKCKGCRVKLLEGDLAITPEDRLLLSEQELATGWRLACRARAMGDLKLELAQWETAILGDDASFRFTPGSGYGVAIDLGTTTIAAQLLDLRTGHVLAVRTALNAQARHGADIMSRVDFALTPGGHEALQGLVQRQIGGLVEGMAASLAGGQAELRRVVVVGNTVMHHLFCGRSVTPLAHHPFVPTEDGAYEFSAHELGWRLDPEATIRFLPCLGGFVGSDLLAGILATHQHGLPNLSLLVDLGTNGEIVLGNCERLLCASTAAGPAFEGARISMGMRAATGAISSVSVRDGRLECHSLGEGPPRGLCGSGLVDAVSASLDLGWILPSGRLAQGGSIVLAPPVVLQAGDIRELQLATGAIAAGIRLLLRHWGATLADVERVYLAGAFGNYINRASAQRIGLIPFPPDRVEPAGNTALRGAKIALCGGAGDDPTFASLRAKVRHVSLNEDPEFHKVYVEEMPFPAAV